MKRFEEIKARDIMQRDVVRFDEATPIEQAIETLEEMEIGGAPVVDAVGGLVGVLTKSDISRSSHVRAGKIDTGREWSMPRGDDADGEDDEDAILAREDYSPAVLRKETVGDWMSARVITVTPDATLLSVCKAMQANHIHRVIVVTGPKIEGIITTFDVLRCVTEYASAEPPARAPRSARS